MKRVILAVVCIFALPLLFSPSQNIQPKGETPFSTVALAGHNAFGGWCECGSAGCTCDPGETPGRSKLQPPDTDDDTPKDEPGDVDPDLTPGLMALALALFFWLRMR